MSNFKKIVFNNFKLIYELHLCIYTCSQKRRFIKKIVTEKLQVNYGRTLSSHQFNQTPNVTHSAQDQTYIMKGGQAFDHSICLMLHTHL